MAVGKGISMEPPGHSSCVCDVLGIKDLRRGFDHASKLRQDAVAHKVYDAPTRIAAHHHSTIKSTIRMSARSGSAKIRSSIRIAIAIHSIISQRRRPWGLLFPVRPHIDVPSVFRLVLPSSGASTSPKCSACLRTMSGPARHYRGFAPSGGRWQRKVLLVPSSAVHNLSTDRTRSM
jgi:hypothetical protein